MKRAILGLLLLLLCGCGVTPASTLVSPDGLIVIGPPAMRTFAPEAGTGPAFVLAAATIEETRATLALRPRDLGAIHGLAFRVVFDPAAAEFVGFTPSTAWAVAPLYRVVEARPGVVAIVISQHGPSGAITADEIGRIELKLRGPNTVPIRLERAMALTNNGVRIGAPWRGGVLQR